MVHNLAVDVFQALSDPTRRAILAQLAPGERSAGEIGAGFAVTAPAVSQHLKALREAGLVRVRVDGQRRIYSLDPAGIDEVRKWLAGLQPSPRLEAVARPSVIEMVQGRRFVGRVA
jgi:DNA-binding transcriptional ArsR family regulator